LHLVELPQAEGALKGLEMELMDGAYRNLEAVVSATDPMVGFKNIDVAILVGARPRSQGMERADLLAANAEIFKVQGAALDKVAKKTVKVCVVGNPCNTNALIASKYAPSIPSKNFTALTRLDQSRALSQLASKTGAKVHQIENVIIWGNHSASQYPDVSHATIKGKALSKVLDAEYSQGPFISKVAKRGAEIISVMNKSSAASAAAAACEHVHDWWCGNQQGGWVSMGVILEEETYGIQPGVCYSMPCNVVNGQWQIVQGLSIDEFSRARMEAN